MAIVASDRSRRWLVGTQSEAELSSDQSWAGGEKVVQWVRCLAWCVPVWCKVGMVGCSMGASRKNVQRRLADAACSLLTALPPGLSNSFPCGYLGTL